MARAAVRQKKETPPGVSFFVSSKGSFRCAVSDAAAHRIPLVKSKIAL